MSSRAAEIIAKMQSTHEKMLAFVHSLDETQANRKVGEEGWSARETLGHLVDTERAHRRFIQNVLAGTQTKVEGFDLNRWNAGRVAKRATQSLAEILVEFEQERAETIAYLPTIPADGWEKIGPHAALGEISIEYAATIIGLHERVHLQELEKGMGE